MVFPEWRGLRASLTKPIVPLHNFIVFLDLLLDMRQLALQVLAALLLFEESGVLVWQKSTHHYLLYCCKELLEIRLLSYLCIAILFFLVNKFKKTKANTEYIQMNESCVSVSQLNKFFLRVTELKYNPKSIKNKQLHGMIYSQQHNLTINSFWKIVPK